MNLWPGAFPGRLKWGESLSWARTDDVDFVSRSEKQISEWDFGVGVLGQAEGCRAKEREKQGGIWDVDLGDIWELFVCWQTQIFLQLNAWLITLAEGLLQQPRVRQRLSLPGSSSLNGSCVHYNSFHFHSAASQSCSWLNLPRSSLGKGGKSLGKLLIMP